MAEILQFDRSSFSVSDLQAFLKFSERMLKVGLWSECERTTAPGCDYIAVTLPGEEAPSLVFTRERDGEYHSADGYGRVIKKARTLAELVGEVAA